MSSKGGGGTPNMRGPYEYRIQSKNDSGRYENMKLIWPSHILKGQFRQCSVSNILLPRSQQFFARQSPVGSPMVKGAEVARHPCIVACGGPCVQQAFKHPLVHFSCRLLQTFQFVQTVEAIAIFQELMWKRKSSVDVCRACMSFRYRPDHVIMSQAKHIAGSGAGPLQIAVHQLRIKRHACLLGFYTILGLC